jgi:hypothetical protein
MKEIANLNSETNAKNESEVRENEASKGERNLQSL